MALERPRAQGHRRYRPNPPRQAAIHIYAQLHHGSSRAIEANRSLLPKGR